ncbi:MAG: type III pantothenate kinase [Prevotella sp.]|nr:type III pantothenate kinase [Candidatus Prevotella equi]
MYTLAVDMGNSSLAVGIMNDNGVAYASRIKTDRQKTEMHYLLQFRQILSEFKIDASDINGSILSSVVPELNFSVLQAMKWLTGKNVMMLGNDDVNPQLEIDITDPSSLGKDRIADCVGAIENYPAPMMIIDMGTATTVNIINDEKKYIGGMIIPGVKISLNALSKSASQLPRVPIEAPRSIVGRNTTECMKSGVIYGFASMIDGLIDRMSDELGFKPTVVITGGNSRFIIPYCKHEFIYDEFLLLKGMYYIYKRNQAENN